MGYYDEDGHYHSFRHGIHRAAEHAADRVLHPFDHHHHHHHRDEHDVSRTNIDIDINESSRVGGVGRRVDYGATPGPGNDYVPGYIPRSGGVRIVDRCGPSNTITVPCHHIRVGDLLILQGRPCQVIRITTSSSTGQHRYLGVDLFNKQLYEESSFATNPSASVYVQNMLAPIFKQYRVLDMRADGFVVAMTETGDIKQGLPIHDQNNLFGRLHDAFANGRGSIRVLVIQDGSRELAVDYKTIYGSRL